MSTRFLQATHVVPMGNSWATPMGHIKVEGEPPKLRGMPMACAWTPRGLPTSHPWGTPGIRMSYPSTIHEVLLAPPWATYGLTRGLPMGCYQNPIRSPWDAYGMPLGWD